MAQRRTFVLAAALAGSLLVAAPAAPAAPAGLTVGSGETEGGVFTAGIAGATFRLAGDAEIVLDPGTRIARFHKPSALMLDSTRRTTPTHVFVLRQGRVQVRVPESPAVGKRHAVLVRGPGDLGIIVQSGRAVASAGDEVTVVANLAGTSLSAVNDAWRPLAAGSKRVLDAEHPKPAPEPLMASPAAPAARRAVWVASRGDVAIDGISWKSVAGARSYALVVEDEAGELVHEAVERATRLGTAPRFGPGRYRMTVSALDRHGIPGQPSAPAQLFVVGVELPEGAFLDSRGTVRIPRARSFHLTHAEGLVATQPGGRWIPATSELGLDGKDRTRVFVRHPARHEMASIRVEQRGVSAAIEFGPKNARWPRDEAEIVVRLESTDGAHLHGIEPTVEVKVGLDPVEVAWTRDGSSLRGTVPPSSSPGPWVLRVSVRDQHGNVLGRDFYEIAKTEQRRRPPRAVAKTGR